MGVNFIARVYIVFNFLCIQFFPTDAWIDSFLTTNVQTLHSVLLKNSRMKQKTVTETNEVMLKRNNI